MTTYGVTLTGFVRKSLNNLLDELKAAVKDAFGTDKRVDAKSPIGILLGIFAQPLGEAWEVMQAVYSAFDPDSAEGAALDTVLSLTGTQRKSLVHSTVDAVLTGTVGTTISAGSIASTSDAGDQFETLTSLKLNQDACKEAVVGFSEAVTSGNDYTIAINGHNYTVTATGGSTTATILAALKAMIDAGPDAPVLDLVTVADPIATITATSADDLFLLAVSSTMTVSSVSNIQSMQAVEEGEIAATKGKLTVITTPISGWTAVNNLADASLGAGMELDSAARQRRAQSLAAPGKSTVDAIWAALSAIPGVTNCTVLENITDATDANNLYPHSVLAVIVGGTHEVIAACLWAQRGGGMGLNVGNPSFSLTTEQVIDYQGREQTVGWQIPAAVKMWVKITYTENTEEVLPSNAAVLMLDAALLAGQEHQPGQDVLPERFHGPVFDACKGIRTLLIEVALDAGGSPGSYQSTPYTISAIQIADFDSIRITVVKA